MTSPPINWISSGDPPDTFPDIEIALVEPDGLLAAGGDLSEQRLLYAYRHGIFPWFNDGQPILWWSPDPRCVLRPEELHVGKRLQRALRSSGFQISFNSAFADVIKRCADNRDGQDGTWITMAMNRAYNDLHTNGWAHSVEVWSAGKLVGGLYGLAIDHVFFGESMFTRETNASKAAMLALCRILSSNEFALFDCQIESPHLISLGARSISRSRFIEALQSACKEPLRFGDWPPDCRSIVEYMR